MLEESSTALKVIHLNIESVAFRFQSKYAKSIKLTMIGIYAIVTFIGVNNVLLESKRFIYSNLVCISCLV